MLQGRGGGAPVHPLPAQGVRAQGRVQRRHVPQVQPGGARGDQQPRAGRDDRRDRGPPPQLHHGRLPQLAARTRPPLRHLRPAAQGARLGAHHQAQRAHHRSVFLKILMKFFSLIIFKYLFLNLQFIYINLGICDL